MAVNLTPNSESQPSSGEGADGLLQKKRLQYDREDKAKAEKERVARATSPFAERRTREAGATGAVAYALEPRFKQAVEHVQQQLRTGRVTLAQIRAENTADEARLVGWRAMTPRRGTAGYDRLMALKTRVAIRAMALEQEAQLVPLLPPSAPVEMREIGWTDAARAAAVLARRAKALGRRASKIVSRRPPDPGRPMRRLAQIARARHEAQMGLNIHGVPLRV